MITRLRYGNTNTFLIHGTGGKLLVDTDMAGTLPLFYKAIKESGVRVDEISYVLATHYHPDHMGITAELTEYGVQLVIIDVQLPHVHFSDSIYDLTAKRRHFDKSKPSQKQEIRKECA